MGYTTLGGLFINLTSFLNCSPFSSPQPPATIKLLLKIYCLTVIDIKSIPFNTNTLKSLDLELGKPQHQGNHSSRGRGEPDRV